MSGSRDVSAHVRWAGLEFDLSSRGPACDPPTGIGTPASWIWKRTKLLTATPGAGYVGGYARSTRSTAWNNTLPVRAPTRLAWSRETATESTWPAESEGLTSCPRAVCGTACTVRRARGGNGALPHGPSYRASLRLCSPIGLTDNRFAG
jgi:hypothetical protein